MEKKIVICNLCDKEFERYASYDKRRKETFCTECWTNRRKECFVVMGKSIHTECEHCGEEIIVGVDRKKNSKGWLLCDKCRAIKDESKKKYRGSRSHSIVMHPYVYALVKKESKERRLTMQQVIEKGMELLAKEED